MIVGWTKRVGMGQDEYETIDSISNADRRIVLFHLFLTDYASYKDVGVVEKFWPL